MAKRSRGTPRIANRLLKRVRDFVQVQQRSTLPSDATVNITAELAQQALDMLDIDPLGLDTNGSTNTIAYSKAIWGWPGWLRNLGFHHW